MSDLIDKESASEQIHTFQITVMVRYAGCGTKEDYHKYYLNRPEEIKPEEEENIRAFVNTTAEAFTQDFCIRNNIAQSDVLTRIEKVSHWTWRRNFN